MSWKDSKGHWHGTPAYLGGETRPPPRPYQQPPRKKRVKFHHHPPAKPVALDGDARAAAIEKWLSLKRR